MFDNDPPVFAPMDQFFSEGVRVNDGNTVYYRIGQRYSHQGKTILKANKCFERISYVMRDHGAEILADDFGTDIRCEFIRLPAGGKKYLRLFLPDDYDARMEPGTSWLFGSRYPDKPHYWFPLQPVARTYDKFGRILAEETLPILKIDVLSNDSCALFRIRDGFEFVEFILWTMPPDSSLFEELCTLSHHERQSLFLWGSHTNYSGPMGLYDHLIYGYVYKNTWIWPNKWKHFSEVDAQTLHLILHSMWKTTGKQIYQFMKRQLIFSVIARQNEDGSWCHGEWTHDREVQFRHHCSGIHTLAAYYEETRDQLVGSALKNAVEYLREQYEELSIGRWYLHDSLEKNIADIRKAHFSFEESRVFGKSVSNMLCLNTHLDALLALRRYADVTGQDNIEGDIQSGVKAALSVVGLRPAEVLYRILFHAIDQTFLPVRLSRELPFPRRVIRRLSRLMVIPHLAKIKKLFPRLVMPNGYIDRELSIKHFCHVYHAINVMDLLRFRRRFECKAMDEVIEDAIKLTQRMFLLEKWLEEEGTKYALGFWAEAMYLYCLQRPKTNRSCLAETVIALSRSGQGLPPSLLGFNSEYIGPGAQGPYFLTDNPSVLVINLSLNANNPEFLLINGTDSQQVMTVDHRWNSLGITDRHGRNMPDDGSICIPPGEWVGLR